MQIEKLEEFLNAPENKERAERLKLIRDELDSKGKEETELGKNRQYGKKL